MRRDGTSDILDQNRKCFAEAKERNIGSARMTTAQSFSFAGEDPEKAAKAFALAARRVTRPSGAVVFAAGALGERLLELGRAAMRAMPGLPVCLAAGAGV